MTVDASQEFINVGGREFSRQFPSVLISHYVYCIYGGLYGRISEDIREDRGKMSQRLWPQAYYDGGFLTAAAGARPGRARAAAC
jgi:hypothetical protein